MKLAFNLGDYTIIGKNNTTIVTGIPQTLGGFISAILPNVYMITGIILFVILLIGGLMIIVNAGSGNEEAVKNGQKAITASVIGLIIVFTSWWIIRIVEIVTSINIFTP
jgi:hypothetical protein